jgi:hypothetical protein
MPKKSDLKPDPLLTAQQSTRRKGRPRKPKPSSCSPESEYDRREEMLVESFINKVIELRKIENIQQMYEQLPQIKQYLLDSYTYGELGQLSRAPTDNYIEEKIAKRVE